MHWAFIATLWAASSGWVDISVAPSRSGTIQTPWQMSLRSLTQPTARTQDTLKRFDLESRFRRDPAGAILQLEKFAQRAPEPEMVFALAELSWIEAERLDWKRKAEALDHYVDAAAYAFDFLFDEELAAGRSLSDPRFRQAMDLYNGGLDHILRAAKAGGKIEPGGTIALKVHGRELNLKVNIDQSPWKAEDINELLLCSDFEVTGLPTRSYQYGLGVPLIGIRKSEAEGEGEVAGESETESESDGDVSEPGGSRFLPPEMAFPLTAFLRPDSRLRDSGTGIEGARECTLYLLDPVQRRSVVQGQFSLGIEADLTTPLAYMWSRTDLKDYRWRGLFRPGQVAERTGLMLLRPYEEGKIPVVMVHGLMSCPLAWIPMLNELLRDPNIQNRYQFMLYVYPTGVPIPIAAADLRDTLLEAQRQFDPSGQSPTWSRMVLLGHSMGGLLTHAMAVDSGDNFWHLSSYRQFEDLIGPREILEEFSHYTFFQALPFVERVVFLATPHRGSDLAGRTIGRLGSSLISQPDRYTALLSQLVKDNPDAFNSRKFRRLPSSIETLDADSEVLLSLLAMKPRAGVTFHSIIGAKYPGPLATTTDGVVPYRSSHFEGAATEKVVNSTHAVQEDPEAVREVRRIMLEHLNVGAAAVAASPAGDPLAPMPTPSLLPR